ncbi:hypothetical protein Ddc_20462 [Ditylenchus destructor]|nr:hypothetical protein Ddc_20462 [Ditylenchus destructor]
MRGLLDAVAEFRRACRSVKGLCEIAHLRGDKRGLLLGPATARGAGLSAEVPAVLDVGESALPPATP